MWVAWYDFADATDSAGSYTLTPTGTPTFSGGPPSVVTYATADYHTNASLGSAWPSGDGDWTCVVRFKDAGINDYIFQNTARHYIINGSGQITFRLGAGTVANYVYSGSYSGAWITCILEHDTSENTTTLYFLNENGSTSQTGVTGDWSTASMQISESAGVADIDFIAFGNRLLTADERLWFGDNSSEAREFVDL